MMTLGEKFQEARNKQGISIREAAEETKIREDYLNSIEDNSLDIPLPEVYVRGFVKNYARYLKLDKEKIITDFDALFRMKGKQGGVEDKESLGRLTLPENELDKNTPIEKPQKEPEPVTQDNDENKTLYIKIFVISAIVALFVVIVIFVISMFSKDKPEINPELNNTNNLTSQTDGGEAMSSEEISLVAIDDVTVIVTQLVDKKSLFSRRLAKGEQIMITKTGPIEISYSVGKNLVVTKNGKKFKMAKSGHGINVLE